MSQRTPEEKRQYMADWRARKKAKLFEMGDGQAEVDRVTRRPAAPEEEPTKKEIAARFNPEEPIFPKPDIDRGLPRSNYSTGDFGPLIRSMPQKAIDAILDRVNIHKGREPRS